jgi:hypothetical protein
MRYPRQIRSLVDANCISNSSLILDRNFESVEQNEADQQDDRNNCRRRVMAYQSAASNQNDREKGPNYYVTDLRVLVARHRSLSESVTRAAC